MVSPEVGRELLKVILASDDAHHDDYRKLYDEHHIRLLTCVADGIIVETADLSAADAVGNRLGLY